MKIQCNFLKKDLQWLRYVHIKIISNSRVRRKKSTLTPTPQKKQKPKKRGGKKAIGLPKFMFIQHMYNYFDAYLPLQKLARKLWKQESEKRARTLRKRKAWLNTLVRASTHSYGPVAPPTALPASFVTRTPATAVQQQARGKTYPKKKKKSKREREPRVDSYAWWKRKERKQKEKVGYF